MNICKNVGAVRKEVELIQGHLYVHDGYSDIYLYCSKGTFANLETGATWQDTQENNVKQLTDVTYQYCLQKVK